MSWVRFPPVVLMYNGSLVGRAGNLNNVSCFCPGSPTGRDSGLKIRPVWVRIPFGALILKKEISRPSRGVPLLHATLLCGHKLRCKCGYNTGISVQARVFISSSLNWRRSMPGINPIGRDDWLKPNTVRVQIPPAPSNYCTVVYRIYWGLDFLPTMLVRIK